MKKFDKKEIVDKVAETLVRASSTYRPDQIRAFKCALDKESNKNAQWVLEKLVENAVVAECTKSPLCDDTGTPHIILEIGKEAELSGEFLQWLEEGVAKGLRDLPARAMGVLGDEKERVAQSKGLSEDPGFLALAPIRIKYVEGDKIRVNVLMLGGGPELRGKTLRVFHKHNFQYVLDQMVEWAIEAVTLLGCQPAILAFGIGRTNFEASALALEALNDADFDKQSDIEQEITKRVCESQVGALGVGGDNSVIATFVKIGPQRASGWRVLSLRTECCVGPRKSYCEF